MGRAASCWGFAPILGRVSGLRPGVVLVWHTQRGQEHLLGLRRLDCTGPCRDRGSDRIWIAWSVRKNSSVETGGSYDSSCEHLERLSAEDFPSQKTPGAYEEYLTEGTVWVALREYQSLRS